MSNIFYWVKKYIIKIVIECDKRCQNIFYWVKKDLFGCFRIEENEVMIMKQV